MFGIATTITIKTLWYSLLWLTMMLIGGACYEQRFYTKKHANACPCGMVYYRFRDTWTSAWAFSHFPSNITTLIEWKIF